MSPRPSLFPRSAPLLAAAVCGGVIACGGCGGGESEPGFVRPRNVILISLDTLRADHSSLYGYAKPTTPFLEELAAGGGVVFENHMVNSNNTLTSHATMMTGLYPHTHDAYDKGTPEKQQALAKSFRTAAELFSDAGFATASFTTHPIWLGEEFGVMQGFDPVQASWTDAPTKVAEFLEWYDREKPERMFAFLHFYDAHSESQSLGGVRPYDSTDELVAQFAGATPEGFTGCLKELPDQCTSLYLHGISEGLEELPPEHLEYLKGLYDAGVRQLDDHVRALFAELAARNLLRESLILITSDHGEDFMEHGTLLHGTIYDPIMHVPMLVLLPEGAEPSRRRISDGTRTIDIAPTLLDFAGLQEIGQGESLVPAIMYGEDVRHVEAFFAPAVLRTWDDDGLFKLFAVKEAEFYDLEVDPGETRNIFDDPELVEIYRERVDRASERVKELRAEAFRARDLLKKPDETGGPRTTEEVRKQLESLGYIDGEGGEEE